MDETHNIFQIIGVLSAVVFVAGDVPYFRDTLNGSTKPHRVTWGIIFLLNIIAFANQYASGASNSLWLYGAVIVATGAIFMASIKKGVGGQTKTDIFALVSALVGIALWVTFDSPLLSILANLFASLVAVFPTFLKAAKHPESETGSAFLFGGISSAMGAISVGKLDFDLLILPIAGVIIQGYLVYLIYLRPAPEKEGPR